MELRAGFNPASPLREGIFGELKVNSLYVSIIIVIAEEFICPQPFKSTKKPYRCSTKSRKK
jgi:hypothetical protein